MKVLVIGLGHAGQRHARLLEELGHTVICYDVKGWMTFEESPDTSRIFHASSLESALKAKPDAAIIATPPAEHCEPTLACLKACIPRVLVEKPLALNMVEANVMLEVADHHGAKLSVGYMLRAVDVLTEITNYPYAAHFVCCWQPKPTTYPWAGVVAESSHEIDLAIYLFGPPRQALTGWQSQDLRVAQLIGRFGEGGVMCSFHLDTRAPTYSRGFVTYGDKRQHAYELSQVSWDIPYRKQLEAFLKDEPYCPAREAMETVKLIEAWI